MPQVHKGADSYPAPATASTSEDATMVEGDVLLPGDEDDEGLLISPESNGNDPEQGEEDNDDESTEVQDYRQFTTLLGTGGSRASTPRGSATNSSSGPLPNRKQQISSQTIRKGEKDFEEQGTRSQRDALEQSRAVMESVLAHTRVHYGGAAGAGGSASGSDIVRGWYFPDAWKDEKEEGEGNGDGTVSSEESNGRRFAHTRHRVVMVEAERGPMFASVGAVPGKPKWVKTLTKEQQPSPQPGFDRVWLLPEEALFLVERGTMELWWPLKPLEAVLGAQASRKRAKTGWRAAPGPEIDEDEAEDGVEDDDGVPLSLQAAYALLIGPDDDSLLQRGRISLPSFQVYTHLRRAGYQVLRAVKSDVQAPLDPLSTAVRQPSSPAISLWQWLFSLLAPRSSSSSNGSGPSSPYGPLVQPGLYRSYGPIYAQLHLIPSHQHNPPSASLSTDGVSSQQQPENPFRVVFHVWKASSSAAGGTGAAFSKTRPPPPDFYLAVADARATGVPTLDQVTELLASVPPLPAKAPEKRETEANRPSSRSSATAPSFPPLPVIYRRLKQGRRCVIVAVVDHGIVNYMRFTDGTFGAEPLWPRFDMVAAGRFGVGGARKAGSGGKGAGSKGKGRGQGKRGTKNGKGGGKAKGETQNSGGGK